mmetsp:Transcript_27082/g.86943  ORF Transcript_27082/g.86943 Transcript_27082/m.86943 type:complete len:408 (-) Transcript_27082:39-1262(-)
MGRKSARRVHAPRPTRPDAGGIRRVATVALVPPSADHAAAARFHLLHRAIILRRLQRYVRCRVLRRSPARLWRRRLGLGLGRLGLGVSSGSGGVEVGSAAADRLGEEGVAHHPLQRQPHLRVHHQHLPDQVLRILRHGLPLVFVKLVLGLRHLREQRLLLVGGEGAAAGEDHVEQHTHRPHIRPLPVLLPPILVVVPSEHLGSDIVRSPAKARQRLLRRPDAGVAKVNHLDRRPPLLRVQDVLRLDVAVHDLRAVQVLHGAADLRKQVGRRRLYEGAEVDDAVEELAAGEELHHDVCVAVRGHHFLERHDVRVLQLAQDGNLRLERLEVLLVAQRRVFNNLDGVGAAVALLRRALHHGEAAAAELCAERVAFRDGLQRDIRHFEDARFVLWLEPAVRREIDRHERVE